MKKTTGMSMQDLDILGDIGEESTSMGGGIDDVSILDGIDFSKGEEGADATTSDTSDATGELPVTDTVESEVESESDTTPTIVEGDSTNESKEEDELNNFINQLLEGQAELEDKAQEVVEAASESNDPELIKLVDELQTMIAEKNLEIEELKKSNEVTLSKYLNKFGEDTDMSLYKSEVDILESTPKLRALVKFRNSDNEKVKTKVDNIVIDLVYDRTGIDVSELLDKKDKDTIGGILNTPDSNSPMISELAKPEEDKDMNYEDSINQLF